MISHAFRTSGRAAGTDAQAVVCDGIPASLPIPTGVLGPSTDEHAGHLSKDATASQIDVALRAVAAGSIVSDPQERLREFGEVVEPHATALVSEGGSQLAHERASVPLDLAIHLQATHRRVLCCKR
jgi:hypothetical protein